ncbi:nuclear transport factor 2 family protein [Maribacter sp. X9]|uniref:nuclear transport factor 2 family protein n=1 Tax=Maribacter sp. X9 TaxID=3402159 RepID=UPI003AF3F4CA
MKKISLVFLSMAPMLFGQQSEKNQISKTLDTWHAAAAAADFEAYFNLMTDDAVFIGTDAEENWQLDAFKSYAKPHFDKGKAWNFTAVERNIYIDEVANLAWFDELLDTQMKLCRGSGILKKEDGKWKIAHYVLSIAVPNEYVDELVGLKRERDSILLNQLKMKN